MATLAVAAALAGCGAPTQPGASAPRRASVQVPPGFPDLSGFTEVDPKPYVQVWKAVAGIHFTTPTLTCSWPYSDDSPLPLLHVGVTCVGAIPGMPETAATLPKPRDCDWISMAGSGGPRTDHGLRAYTFIRGTGACPAPPDDFRLAPGSTLSASSITCAVTQDGVACVDPVLNHGFVLSPAGSWSF